MTAFSQMGYCSSANYSFNVNPVDKNGSTGKIWPHAVKYQGADKRPFVKYVASGRLVLTAQSVAFGALLDLTALPNVAGSVTENCLDATGLRVRHCLFKIAQPSPTNGINLDSAALQIGSCGTPPFAAAFAGYPLFSPANAGGTIIQISNRTYGWQAFRFTRKPLITAEAKDLWFAATIGCAVDWILTFGNNVGDTDVP